MEDGTNLFIFFSIKDPKQDYENFHETITSKMLWKKTNSTDWLAECYVEMQKKTTFYSIDLNTSANKKVLNRKKNLIKVHFESKKKEKCNFRICSDQKDVN